MGSRSTIVYRPDIDGLRALAVLSVVGYHAAPAAIPGGFTGVDIFFVISGFLISSIILAEQTSGHFSPIAFYARRVRRLFPALLLVLFTVALLSWLLMLPPEFVKLGTHLFAGAAYAINFVLVREFGYFDSGAELKPLLHLWSLAIEEQFYIAWPLFLLLWRAPRTVLLAIVAIWVVSIAASVVTTWLSANVGNHSKMAFFLPHNRFWEIASGALLAWFAMHGNARALAGSAGTFLVAPVWRELSAATGIVLIVSCIAWLDNGTLNPQTWAFFPCLGTVLVIAAGPNAFVNRHILSRPWLVFVGLISYPLYLWHWPLLSFVHLVGMAGDWRFTVAALGLSAVLAYGTYRFIEKPVRRMPGVAVPATLMGLSLFAAAIGALAQARVLSPRLPSPPGYEEALKDWRYGEGGQEYKTSFGLKGYKIGRSDKSVLFVGDSNMQQYWPRVRRLVELQPRERSAIFVAQPGCAPIPGIHVARSSGCQELLKNVLKLAHEPSIAGVVLAASWVRYFNTPVYRMAGDDNRMISTGSKGWHQAFANLQEMVADLEKSGKWVWLVFNIPHDDILAATKVIVHTHGDPARPAPVMMRSKFDSRWLPVRDRLMAVARSTKAGVVEPMKWLCDAKTCSGRTRDGQLIYTDGGHLRATFARERATFMDVTLGPPRPAAYR